MPKQICRFLLFLVMAFSISAQSKKPNAFQQTAELFVAAYNSNTAAPVEKEFNFQMRAAVTSEQFAQFMTGTAKDYGKILKLDAPRFLDESTAVFPLTLERGSLDLMLSLDADGKISGLRLMPGRAAKPSKQPIIRNKTKLGLPFKGEWLIFWGGDTVELNQHQNAPNQRFAFDIIKLNENENSHSGDGSRNEDYYAFGQEITAPAEGMVTDVINGVQDNVPGVKNEMFVPGNMIVIKHADGEYSLFAHLKFGSTRVKVGEKIKRGQVIGLCGNSGNSSEPHLHYQLQKSALFENEGSIKVFFDKINVRRAAEKSAIKNDYSPVKGDLVNSGL